MTGSIIFSKIKNIRRRLATKGYIESFVFVVNALAMYISSIGKTLFLRMRGYRITFGVVFRGSVDFFQTAKNHISVKQGTIIGKNTRINAGFKGTISIGKNVLLDDGCYIMAQESIRIGNNTQIAAYTFITDFNHVFSKKLITISNQGYRTDKVVIGNDVWIGTHCVILPGVTIGDGAVIGAGTIVTKNVKSYAVVAGNPMRFIRNRS
jgi:acetyltransferase-like isoleucine patch superfamily enzyme